MNKKGFLILASLFLSAIILFGCNQDNDPAPPPEQTTDEDVSVEDPIQKAEDLEEDTRYQTEVEENRDERAEEEFEKAVDDLEKDPDTNSETP